MSFRDERRILGVFRQVVAITLFEDPPGAIGAHPGMGALPPGQPQGYPPQGYPQQPLGYPPQ